jgi:hypothetical protein
MMSLPRLAVRTLSFDPDGSLTVEYLRPAIDARANGVVLNHTMYIPVGDQYDEEIDAVRVAVEALLDDVLEDLPHMEPIREADVDDEDDDD